MAWHLGELSIYRDLKTDFWQFLNDLLISGAMSGYEMHHDCLSSIILAQ